jgi:hypothetical protein
MSDIVPVMIPSAPIVTGVDLKSATKRSNHSTAMVASKSSKPTSDPLSEVPSATDSSRSNDTASSGEHSTDIRVTELVTTDLLPNTLTSDAVPAAPILQTCEDEVSSGSVATPETTSSDAELEEKITKLWSANGTASFRVKKTRDELAKNRRELAEALYNYKERLGGTGRDGKWAPFLRKNGISKTTADRYVQQHKGLLNPAQKLPSGELILTAEQIDKLAARVSRGLAKVLVMPDSVSIFLEALQCRLKERTGICGEK